MPTDDFALPDLSGKLVRLSDFRGKTVLLNFWTTWCTACLTEIPDLVELQRRNPDRLVILGVSLDGVADEHGHNHDEAEIDHETSQRHRTTERAKIRSKVEQMVKAKLSKYPVCSIQTTRSEVGLMAVNCQPMSLSIPADACNEGLSEQGPWRYSKLCSQKSWQPRPRRCVDATNVQPPHDRHGALARCHGLGWRNHVFQDNLYSSKPRTCMSHNAESAVKERYAAAAKTPEAALCCPINYEPDLLAHIPQEVIERDYGCGNPSRYLKPGETVLDLGSGTGKICFIASKIVGPTGHVIGIDMTDEMLAVARRNAPTVAERLGYPNVEFRKGRIQIWRLISKCSTAS